MIMLTRSSKHYRQTEKMAGQTCLQYIKEGQSRLKQRLKVNFLSHCDPGQLCWLEAFGMYHAPADALWESNGK